MPTDRDTTRIVRSWLEEGRTALPDYLLDAVLDQLPATRQRRSWWPARRFARMPTYTRLALAAAAAVIVAVVGLSVLPIVDRGVGGSPSPSPTASPPSSPATSPTPVSQSWSLGNLASGRVSAALRLCDPRGRPCNTENVAFSFDLPTSAWESRYSGWLEKGTFPTASHASIIFLGPIDTISTDPCAAVSETVNGSVTEMATAVTTIGGTDAVGPTDVTVGGLPGKLVVLTIHDDIPCNLAEFWLFGDVSLYPNTFDSTIRIRFLELQGTPFTIYTDQDGPNPVLEAEIQQIVDSIRFE